MPTQDKPFVCTLLLYGSTTQIDTLHAELCAQHVETRKLYAIKVFSVFDKDKRSQLLKEVETLSSMECPSLINFVGGYLKVREGTLNRYT